MWAKVKAWFKNSLTILWARVVAFTGVIVATVQGNPTVDAAIHEALQPKFIPYYVIAIGIVTELARRRTVSK